MADGRVILDIDGDDKNFLKELGSLGSKIDRQLGGVQKSFASVGGSFTKYVTAPLLAAGGAIIAFGIKSAASFEQTGIALETMLGSAKAGQKMFSDLKKFAAETPFELPGLLDASKKLLAFGFAASDIIPTLRSVGDASAALGLGTEGMERVITALGQIKAKGKASAEEMLQLAESGIPAWEALAKKIGKSIPEAMKLAEKGAIDAETAISAVTEMMDAKFGGMMLRQATTLNGLISTFKDVFSIRLGEAFERNLEPMKETLTELIDVAGPLVDALVPSLIAVLDAAMPVIGDITDALKAFADASPETQKAILMIVAAAALLGPTLQVAAGGMKALTAASTLLGSAKVVASIGNLGAAFSIVSTNMGASVGALATMGGSVAAVSAGYVALAGAAGYAIGSIINQIPEVAQKQREWGEALGEFIYQQGAEQIATDAQVEAWRAAGIQLDENNNLTDIGVRQLAAHTEASRRNAGSTDRATGATRGATAALVEFENALIAVRNEQVGAERADIALERAKNRLEDAQRDYTKAVTEHGPASREAEDAALNLRDAELDVEDAANRAAAAQDTLNEKLAKIPRPRPGDLQGWVAYYQAIGDKAAYAAAQANLANNTLLGGRAKSSTGGRNIPVYGSGGYVDTFHLAGVGDVPEIIFPLGDMAFFEKFMPKLLASLPGRRGVSTSGGATYVDNSMTVNARELPSSYSEGVMAMRDMKAGLVR